MTLAMAEDKNLYYNPEWRKYMVPLVQRIFAQLIYIDFIYTLRDVLSDDTNGPMFRLNRDQIAWLNKTFVREGLGTAEQGNLCLFPVWDRELDRENERSSERLTIMVTEGY